MIERHFTIDKFNEHHIGLICQGFDFAIVLFPFCIVWLINTWREIYSEIFQNWGSMVHKTMEIKWLSSFLSSLLTAIFLHQRQQARALSPVVHISNIHCDILALRPSSAEIYKNASLSNEYDFECSVYSIKTDFFQNEYPECLCFLLSHLQFN